MNTAFSEIKATCSAVDVTEPHPLKGTGTDFVVESSGGDVFGFGWVTSPLAVISEKTLVASCPSIVIYRVPIGGSASVHSDWPPEY